jgi:hypothetical protein
MKVQHEFRLVIAGFAETAAHAGHGYDDHAAAASS